jgi:hypothetical protein
LLIKGPPYWQPALAGGAAAISSAAISRAANPPTTQRFMVVSRHIAAGALPSAWGGKYRRQPSQQSMTLPPMQLVFAAFEVVIRRITTTMNTDYEHRSEHTISSTPFAIRDWIATTRPPIAMTAGLGESR